MFNTDIPYERSGNIPSREYYDKMYKDQWNSVTIRSLGIGQGEVLVTPLQLANIAAMIANEGYYYPPHLIKCFGDTTAIPEVMTTRIEPGIDRKYFKVMKAGLRTVFSGPAGTARRFELSDIPQCGKTGTAQNPHGNYHSNFIAFAPADNPKMLGAVLMQDTSSEFIVFAHTKRVHFEAEKPILWTIDGENGGEVQKGDIVLCRNAIEMFV